jgi:hypothetical protein
MHDAHAMRLADSLAGLDDPARSVPQRNPAGLSQLGTEIDPLQVLHDDVWHAVVPHGDVDQPDDVLALDLPDRTGLLQEALNGVLVLAALRRHELDGDPLFQVDLLRRDHLAHVSPAQTLPQAIPAGEEVPLLHSVAHWPPA